MSVYGGSGFPITGLSVSFSEEMKNLILSTIPGEVRVQAEQSLSAMVGQSMPVPDITEFNEDNSSDYKYLVGYREQENGMLQEATIQWSEDKEKVLIARIFEVSDGGSGTVQCSYQYLYDDTGTNPVMTFKAKQIANGMTMTIWVTLKETGSNNGVKIDVACTSDIGSSIVTFKIVGEADQDGGFIEVTVDDGAGTEESYKETFNASGTNTGFCDDDTVSCAGFDSGSYVAPTDLTSQLNITISGSLTAGNYVVVPAGSIFDSSDPTSFIMSIVGMGYYNGTDWEFADFFGEDSSVLTDCLVFKETESSGELVFTDVTNQIGGVTIP
jgi:hypothetical protein